MVLLGVEFEPNRIYCGDSQEVMRRFPEQSVDLVYADPPFFSNRHYEVIWGDGYELRAFEDRWKGGIQNYLAWMEPKLRECHRILKDTGALYLHCDWHASAYLRVEMDKIFGDGNFRGEIVWKRGVAHSDSKQGAKHYGHIHDTILFYTKTDDYIWNQQYTAYDEGYVSNFYSHVEEGTGRRFQLDNLTAAKPGGDTSYAWRGVKPYKGRYWAYSKARMEEFERQGRLYYTKTGMPRYKRYLDEMPGVPLQDIWTDVKPAAMGKEAQGYPTQKPELLLQRIVNTSSNPTDIVLDPFCGCGTAVAVAHRLGRRWIGIDVSPTACKLMAKRLRALRAKVGEPLGLPKTVEELRNLQPFEFQNWVFEMLHGRVNPKKTGDMGIDGWVDLDIPTQVKRYDSVGRVDVDKFETALERAEKDRGVIVGFGFTKDAYEEVARAKNDKNLDIRLKTVEEILKES